MTDAIVTQANSVYRDYSVDGVPSSGANNPAKADIRTLWATLAATLDSLSGAGAGSGNWFTTLALLNADLDFPANALAEVVADSTVSNNGIYLKSGSIGSGSWTQVSTVTLSGLSATIAAETTRATTAEALKAPLASPALTGSPTTPNQTALDNSTKIANTHYADSAVAVETTRATAVENDIVNPQAITSRTGATEFL